MAVERYLEHDDRVVVITGACEQHGYVSLLSDVIMPVEIVRAACEAEDVLIAPPLPFGISPYFAAYPGTISLNVTTFTDVVREVLSALMEQGFRRVLVSNGHGGNTGVLTPLLVELGNAYPAARFELFQWWTHPAVVRAAEAAGLPQRHANWSENFRWTNIGPAPEENKPFPEVARTASAAATRAVLGDGSYGGPYAAPDAVMDSLFAAAVAAMTDALKDLRRYLPGDRSAFTASPLNDGRAYLKEESLYDT
jgi:creatinine amidohydrolase